MNLPKDIRTFTYAAGIGTATGGVGEGRLVSSDTWCGAPDDSNL